MNPDNQRLLDELRGIVGADHVLTDPRHTQRFRTGFRFGFGSAIAVARPGSLLEQWRLVQACVAHDKIVIMQAANTGLTGGSTPDGNDYDREIVIISTLRMKKIQLIRDGRQVICFPGATLDQLEKALKPLGREPHSVIGSSCIGASVFGGICNNSGGSLVQRGPAFTEMAVFAQLGQDGKLSLVNHLGISLGQSPEDILRRLDDGTYRPDDIHDGGRGSDQDYARHVRDVDADSPARFNADPKRLFEASGSAGKLILFAVRLDTFPAETQTDVFYIGTNDPAELTDIRRYLLTALPALPIAGEYMHRDAFDIADVYGKDTFLAIRRLGTARLPAFFALKARVDNFCARFSFLPRNMSDRLLQFFSARCGDHLPARLRDFRARYEHHLMIKVSRKLTEPLQAFLDSHFKKAAGAYFLCSPEEGAAAFLLRFAAAGAAVRYRAMHPDAVEDIVALDIALKRNERDWLEVLPEDMETVMVAKLYYGHFLCHVFHQDYIVKKGVDCLELEHRMWKLLDARGAQYPAEHNVGHLYRAGPELRNFYRALDPCNQFNPGVGQLSKRKNWA
ncbi:D-lactate dehydrogenase [Achromobacter dolens]|uniref:D-lactate dehydrogenase n=1 Tax=Achromobacter dolens TaxID=1287738 RepID=UPI0007DE7718|nr:D-lactate dehydrogenase [Achromobacter dolens]OAS88433.1 D-lactate dehydrogenase [Achromobacter xylosoxidans]CAB3628877.1 Quinone-dependent D-lactate dehydrogenase [Achromobacter dolens]